MLDEKTSYKIKVLSLVSIVMVLYIHSYNLGLLVSGSSMSIAESVNFFIQEFISQGLARVSIPIFFIISGFFLFKNFSYSSYPKILIKRYHSLVIPYLFWSILVVGIFYLLQNIPSASSFFDRQLVEHTSLATLVQMILINPKNYPLWFIRDLIILIIVSPIIYYILKHYKSVYFILLLFLWLFFHDYNSISFTFYKPDVLLFFSIGGCLALYNQKILTLKISNKSLMLLFVLYISLLLGKTYFVMTVDGDLFIEVLLRKISIILGVFVVWFLLDRVSLKSFNSMTQFTFLLFVFHEPLLTILKKGLLFIVGESHVNAMLIYLVTPALTIYILSILGHYMKKYLPRVTSVVTGNRI